MSAREGLIARIRQIRRATADTDPPPPGRASPDSDRFEALERRIAHLERLVEGLQDSVHRESQRQSKLLTDLEARIQPAALHVALSKDLRERGL